MVLKSCLAVALVFLLLILPACSEQPVVGAVDQTASVALIRYETQSDGYDGVVYRQVNRLGTFMAQSEIPVLIVFYSPDSAINTLVIPVLEQMAVNYKNRLQIVWIDAKTEIELAESFTVDNMPQFSVTIQASLKKSMVGFDDEGAYRLKELIEPYLTAP